MKPQHRLPAVFMRGGTSKAVMLRREDVPEDRKSWDAIFLSIMGSPDPSGRQLDGMGGGVSSLSKVCIVGPASRPDADVDYTFAQVAVRDAVVDYSGNCGNMSSAIGPFAIDEGLLKLPDGKVAVRIHNTNTSKIVVARFDKVAGIAATEGDFVIDGVAGAGAPIRLEFMSPGGTTTNALLPTARPRDVLDVPRLGAIEATLVDAATPCVFVRASDLGKRGDEMPDALDADAAFLETMEAVRRAGSIAMGIAGDADQAGATRSVPKVAMIAPPGRAATLSGQQLGAAAMDIAVRMISIGQPHRAVPLTGALCLAVAARLPGSLPHEMAGAGTGDLRIAHASGLTVVDAKVENRGSADGGFHAEYAAVYRTARRLFEGHVFYRGVA